MFEREDSFHCSLCSHDLDKESFYKIQKKETYINDLLQWQKKAFQLLKEVHNSHKDPSDPYFNHCNDAKCQWCSEAEELFETIKDN
jgi:hypothetical protein